MELFVDYVVLLAIAATVLCGLIAIERFVRWLCGAERKRFTCGRCELHGSDAEHDLHLAQNLPDPFTGVRPLDEIHDNALDYDDPMRGEQ